MNSHYNSTFFVVVSITSNKPSEDISDLDVSIICFSAINLACDFHYLKLLGILHQNRYLGPVDQTGVDILGADIMGVDVLDLNSF